MEQLYDLYDQAVADRATFLSKEGVAGVLLMTFGTAETLDDVPAYLASVRGGRPAPSELVAEFQRRFALVGGSPLTRITREQAQVVEADHDSPVRGSVHGSACARQRARRLRTAAPVSSARARPTPGRW